MVGSSFLTIREEVMSTEQGSGRLIASTLLAFLVVLSASVARAGPGARDPTYAPVVTGGAVNAMVLQPDDRLLIAGAFTAVNGSSSRSRLARLFADGSLDPTFFNSGVGVSATAWCLALQPDRRILIGGDFTLVNGAKRTKVARLNSDGSIDGSFVPSTNIGASVLAVAVQSDNKVLIGGSFSGGTFPNWNARLNADGTTDTAFSSIPNGPVNAIAIQSDAKIVIGGAFTTVNGAARNRIARLNADGSLDNTFLNGLGGAPVVVRCLQIQPDGKVLIGGDFIQVNGSPRGRIARLNSNGSLDTGFASSPGANEPVYAIALQPDSSVLIAGAFATYGSSNTSRVARLHPDGTRDGSFTAVRINNLVRALAVQGDGAILTGGTFTGIDNANVSFLGRLYGDLYPPEFVTQPASRSTNIGTTVTFSALVKNSTPSTYQWRKDGETIPLATGASYTLFDVQLFDEGTYSALVSNAAGRTVSSNAVLKVGFAPTITKQPSGLSVTQGQSAAFTVEATGTPLSYAWRKNGKPIATATNSTFTIPATVRADSATYSVVVSNFLNSITSAAAVLTVNVPASITVQPVSQTVGEGEAATFSIAAEGTAVTYQWFKGDQSIPGAMESSYNISKAQFGDMANYSVMVSNSLAVVSSDAANLTVQRRTPAIVVNPTSQNIPVGSNVTFTVVATGTTLNYQWLKDATNILDVPGPVLSLTNLTLLDAGGYSLIVANPVGSVTSLVAQLNVGYAPFIVEQPQPFTNIIGTSNAFSVTVSGSEPFIYQWRKDGLPITDATNSPLALPNLQSNQVGYYAVNITNLYGWTASSNALLSIRGVPFPWQWQGLMAYYPFNGNAHDESGNDRSLQNNGATLSSDRFGVGNAAYNFDKGPGFLIETNNSDVLLLHDSFTISCWVNIPIFNGATFSLVRKDGDATTAILNNQFYVETYLNGRQYRAFSDVPPAATWCLLTVTWDGATFQQYINGEHRNSSQDDFARTGLTSGRAFRVS